MRFSVVVAAYNEEKTVGEMLRSLLAQKLRVGASLIEVIVVASGCTDSTHAIVERISKEDARVRMIVQTARMGKASALNAYLRERDTSCDITVFASADLIIQPGCLEVFRQAFERDLQVGMVGARPMPINPRDTVLGGMVNFLWDLHHEIALLAPKMGEMAAARSHLVGELDELSAVDEASVEAAVVAQGYRLAYVPKASVVNRGPSNLRDFASQRRRIACGHYWLRAKTGYTVSTMDTNRILKLALRQLTFTNPMTDASYLLAAGLEVASRALGYLDFKRNHSHAVWRIAVSTKEAIDTRAAERPRGPKQTFREARKRRHA